MNEASRTQEQSTIPDAPPERMREAYYKTLCVHYKRAGLFELLSYTE